MGRTSSVTADDAGRAQHDAEIESRFRDSNERLRAAAYYHGFEVSDRLPFVCECPDPACFESVMLRIEDYDRVRAHPRQFVLVAGHEDAETTGERIVEAESGYSVIEKIGIAGEEAARLHPRESDTT